ncbi:N-acetyltransferase family protein [Actinophytocola sp.]|uniref:GNAT family N-acetyltransferase n=1 Tax=Actinophytocola sp. TaxID=1872138 RepID=UPI00389A9A18
MHEIRRARPSDVDAVVELVHALAAHEGAPEKCHLTPEQLHEALFRPAPALYGHVATVDDHVVGYALWFLNFSTWRGTHGIYLEDVFVRAEHRGSGLGKALLSTLAAECVAQGYTRLEWVVLESLASTIEFYKSIGAVPMAEWKLFRLTDEPLRRLGS